MQLIYKNSLYFTAVFVCTITTSVTCNDNQCAKSVSDEADDLLGQANACLSLKQYEKAIEFYNKVAPLTPKNPDIFFYRAYAYAKLNKFKDAIRDYTHVISLEPDRIKAYFYRGGCHLAQKSYEDAIADYSQVIKKIQIALMRTIGGAIHMLRIKSQKTLS